MNEIKFLTIKLLLLQTRGSHIMREHPIAGTDSEVIFCWFGTYYEYITCVGTDILL